MSPHSTTLAPKRPSSGQHPAVKEYRQKLESIGEHTGAELDALDERLRKYVEEVKSDPPPHPQEG